VVVIGGVFVLGLLCTKINMITITTISTIAGINQGDLVKGTFLGSSGFCSIILLYTGCRATQMAKAITTHTKITQHPINIHAPVFI
jgi:hypothetical protein